MDSILTEIELEQSLPASQGWLLESDSLHKEFVFKNFAEAWQFMGRVAALAESVGHHPDWFNSYNVVWISLTTHTVGGVTEKDVTLARSIDESLGQKADHGA